MAVQGFSYGHFVLIEAGPISNPTTRGGAACAEFSWKALTVVAPRVVAAGRPWARPAVSSATCSSTKDIQAWSPNVSDFFNGLLAHPGVLGIHPYVHPGRTRCMRHGLPHAQRIGRGVLLLLFPLRAFGHGRTLKFVDRAVTAGTFDHPITTSVDYSRHLAVAWHIFPAVPGVPLCIDLGRDGHAANLQHRRHATFWHFHAVRVNLFPDN